MTIKLEIGMPAPQFSATNQFGKTIHLNNIKSKWILIYFYPSDGTPGCTLQNKNLSSNYDQFKLKDVYLIGISKNDHNSHCKFANKYGIQNDLLFDINNNIAISYNAFSKKKLLGISINMVQRKSFLIDCNKNIAYIWEKASIFKHATEVLSKIDELDGENQKNN